MTCELDGSIYDSPRVGVLVSLEGQFQGFERGLEYRFGRCCFCEDDFLLL